MFRKIANDHLKFWNAETRRSFYVGLLLLTLSSVIQASTGRYAAKSVTNFVGDLFLDNVPVVHLDFLIVGGSVMFAFGSILLLFLKPRYLLFGIKAAALLMATRAVFLTFTHLGIYPEQISIDQKDFLYGIYKLFDFQGNFFFSGHTGFPFLMGLVFWKDRFWRAVFFSLSFMFGTSVLLAHIHYSIDVFAAPFMAYGIFKITQKIFPRDYALIVDGN